MPIVPNIPRFNKGNMYVNGMLLTSPATTSTLGISVGQCRDSTDTNDINMTSAVVINARLNGSNGLDQGTLAANTFYHVYAVGNSNSNDTTLLAAAVQPVPAIQPPTTITESTGGFFTPAVGLLSLSATAPALPSGFDMFRRIGTVLTSATAAPNAVFLPFRQVGSSSERWMWYDAAISVLAATAAAAFTAQSLAVAVPPLATQVTLQATLLPNAAGNFVALRPTGSASAAGYAKMSGDVAAVSHIDDMTVPCNATPSIDWITDAASTVALAVTTYLDLL